MSLLIEETKPSGFDWIGDTPSSWTVDRIKDIIPSIYGGGTPDSSHPEYWEDGDITWITPTDFQDFKDSNLISDSRRKITLEGLEASATTLLPIGSVVMASRATIGVAKIAGVQLCTNQGFVSFVCERASNEFFRYAIEDYLGDMFLNIASGTTFREISRSEVRRTHFAFPCFAEQRRIVAYLDKGCAAIDGAIRAKRQQLSVLEDLRKSIINKAVTRGLDERVDLVVSGNETIGLMPRLWKRTKFRYEIDVRSGDFVSDKLDDDGAYPVIGGNGLMGRAHDFNVDGEVVVVGRVGAYCGNVHYVKGRAWVSDNALIVESRHDKRFLTYLLRALDLNSFAKKTAQPLVTGTQIKNSHVALPPVDEQRQIVEYLESKTARIKDLESNLSAQITTLEQYRKSLIHECVTGKRRINKEGITVSSL